MSNTPDTQDGEIVAVQYPATVTMSLVPGCGAELAKKYEHLKQLATDDKALYKELKQAIADVAKLRTDNTKEENTIKGPINEFRALVIATGKDRRAEIEPVETRLKAEKQRIDDIIADELEQQRRLWNTNLEMVRAKGQNIFGFDMDQLSNELDIIEFCNLDDFDFGDLIEDAREAKANARIRVEQAIAMEQQRLKVVAQQEELNRQAAEQAAEKHENDWELAALMNRNFDMQMDVDVDVARKKTALEDEKKPDPNVDLVPVPQLAVHETELAFVTPKKSAAPAGFDDDEPANTAPPICANDQLNLELFIVRLSDTASKAGRYESTVCTNSINRCIEQLGKMQEFLTKVKEQ